MSVPEAEIRAFVSRLRLLKGLSWVTTCIFIAGMVFTHPGVKLAYAFVLLFPVLIITGLLAQRRLGRCPRCGEYVFSTGAWCPVCGQRSLEPGSFTSPPHCRECNTSLTKKGRYQGVRTYPVCACSHCGLQLDQEGL